MADNNPFYPGYYPGDPIIKGPPSGGSVIPPSEFNLDQIGEEIDALGEMVTPNIPMWVKEKLMDDYKLAATATFYSESSNVTTESMALFSEEDREDLPGAVGVTFSLNPADWKDPKKQVVKTLKKWGESIFDWQDIDGRTHRQIWSDLLTKDPADQQMGVQETEGYIKKVSRTMQGGVTRNPLKLTGIDPNLEKVENAAVDAILDFGVNYRSTFSREKSYDKMIEANLKLMAKDVDLQLQAGTITDPNALRLGRSFVTRVGFIDSIEEVDKAMDNVVKQSERAMMERGQYVGMTQIRGLETKVSAAKNEIANLRRNIDITAAERARIDGLLGSFDRRLNEITQITDEIVSRGIPTSLGDQKQLMSRLSGLRGQTPTHRALKTGDGLLPGIKGGYMRSFEPALIGKASAEGRDLQAAFGRNGRGSVPKVRAILTKTYMDKDRELYREIADAISKDGGLKLYLWSRIKTTVIGYTPAYYVENALKRVSYLGLVTKDELVDSDPKNPLFRIANDLIKKNKIFQNTFKIGYLDATGNTIKEVFQGASHFEGVGVLGSKILKNQLDAAQLFALFHAPDDSSILALLNSYGIDNSYLEKFKSLRDWIKNNKGAAFQNEESLFSLIKGLHKYNSNIDLNGIGITTKYIGLLQRTGQFLSKLQSTLMNNFLGKLISKFMSFKTMAAEALAGALSLMLPALAPFERIIAAFVRKGLDFVQKLGTTLFKAAFKADMEALDEFLEEAAEGVLKVAKIVVLISIAPMLLIGLLSGVLMSAIPQNNPGKAVGGGGDDSLGGSRVVKKEANCTPIYNCPIKSPTITSYSYNGDPSASASFHGSNGYWEYVRTEVEERPVNEDPKIYKCYAIPGTIDTIRDHPNTGNVCDSSTPKATEYGYALDVIGADKVCAPKFEAGDGGNPWYVSSMFSIEKSGTGVVLEKTVEIDGKTLSYRMLIMHINPSEGLHMGMQVENGYHLGNFFDYPGGKHVHIELAVDNEVQRPEDFMCN
ncbi:MAG: hypothetical protein WC243_00310 [Patescibacteria group bacterium]|jgi:hypothetical protein